MRSTLEKILASKLKDETFAKEDGTFLLNKLIKRSYFLFLVSSFLICLTLIYLDKILKLAYITADTLLNSVFILRPDVWYLGWTIVFFCFTVFVLIYAYYKKHKLKQNDSLSLYKKLFKDFKIIDLLNFILSIIIAINFFFTFLMTPAAVSGRSMEPSFYDGDRIFFESLFVDPKQNDVVIAKHDKDDHFIIKRVRAIPGDRLEYQKEALYVNGKYIYMIDETEWLHIAGSTNPTFVVPANRYLLIGDNFTQSLDSRYLGLFTQSEIIGIYYFRFFPFNRIGF